MSRQSHPAVTAIIAAADRRDDRALSIVLRDLDCDKDALFVLDSDQAPLLRALSYCQGRRLGGPPANRILGALRF